MRTRREPPKDGAKNDDPRGPAALRDLQSVLNSATDGVDAIVKSLRTSFVEGTPNAYVQLQHIVDNFIKPERGTERQAEAAIKDFDWNALAKMTTARDVRTKMDEFKSKTSMLNPKRRGDDEYWMQHAMENVSPAVLAAYDTESVR